MNPTEVTVFVALLALMGFVAIFLCDDNNWPNV